ncbi:MAG: GNAT family N-acetyltransferase [Lachnospiraceae bacterium]|nr:GNAT family N-acetyltransferase [Lachnospiraceae bacterium]
MIYKIEHTPIAAGLFLHWQETMIWSCLDRTMGNIYADHRQEPQSAIAVLGDFCFLTGVPNRELITFIQKRRVPDLASDFLILVPQTHPWQDLIETCYGVNAKKVTRYAFKKELDIFDIKKLQHAVSSLPPEYSLKLIDEDIFHLCQAEDWSRDLVSRFQDYSVYRKQGMGAAVIYKETLVSGASSYSRYRNGIEIEVDTRKEFRQKGLAYACSARLILECLSRNLYPSWDAQNKISVALAEKLGYHYDHEYTAYEIRNFPANQ